MNRLYESSCGDESGVFVLDPSEARVGKNKKERGGDVGQGRSEGGERLEARDWLKKARELPPVRLAKVLKIRDSIARGTYETEERWRIAIDRMIEEIR